MNIHRFSFHHFLSSSSSISSAKLFFLTGGVCSGHRTRGLQHHEVFDRREPILVLAVVFLDLIFHQVKRQFCKSVSRNRRRLFCRNDIPCPGPNQGRLAIKVPSAPSVPLSSQKRQRMDLEPFRPPLGNFPLIYKLPLRMIDEKRIIAQRGGSRHKHQIITLVANQM